MAVDTYKLHRRVVMALHELSDDEKARVLDQVAWLVETPLAEWPAAVARKIPGEPSFYLVHVDDSLRLIVRAIAGQPPEILDIVRRETLGYFTKAAANNGD
jgi:hypothetical protein